MWSRSRAPGAGRGRRGGALAGRGAARDRSRSPSIALIGCAARAVVSAPAESCPGRSPERVRASFSGGRRDPQDPQPCLPPGCGGAVRASVRLEDRHGDGRRDLASASKALADPHADLLATLRGADAVNMDETGSRTAGFYRPSLPKSASPTSSLSACLEAASRRIPWR